MTQFPLTDILIVTHNARQKLVRCLRSVIRHTQNSPYQLTIVDNASSDGTSDHLEKFFSKKIRLIKSVRNLGFSGGVNLLLRETSRPWIVLLDDDAEVTVGWLEKFHAVAQRNSEAGIVSGKLVYPDKRIFCAEFSIVPFGSVGRGELDRGQRNYAREVDAVPGPCWLMPRAVIDKVGPFDERFFPCQYEDIDYCLRVRLAGYKIFYHGKVSIIHHNLYRKGSEVILNQNITRFFRKWGRVLNRFPLCPLTTDGRLINEGARLLQKEDFCPAHPIFGKWTGLNSRFSESLYRGIALTASKQYKKAARAFRETEVVNRPDYLNTAQETTGLYYILSRYFLRLGLKKEAQHCADRVISRIIPFRGAFPVKPDLDSNGLERHYLSLHKWCICIVTNDPNYLKALKSSLPYYEERLSLKSKAVQAGRILEISFLNKVGKNQELPGLIDKKYMTSHCPHFGLYRTIDKKKNRVLVVMNQRKFLRDNWILHGGFLGPLAFLLHFQGAALVHGALLQKNGRGILIVGEKGAGKSTLSTVCLERGFDYFSDEHPILEMGGNRVRGRSFVNDIALPAISVRKNFSHLQNKMRWSKGRKKYLLDPVKVRKHCIGATTEISCVVFPKFKVNAKLSVKRMEKEDFLKRLLEDEYFKVILENQKTKPEQSVSYPIATLLTRAAQGYTIEYGPADIQRLPGILERL